MSMHAYVEPPCSPSWYRLAVFVAIAGLTAGCSSESSRFSDSPFSNPYSARGSAPANSEVTGSIGSRPAQQSARIEAQPLPQAQGHYQGQYQSGALPPPPRATGVAGGGRGLASNTSYPSNNTSYPAASQDVTGSVAHTRPAPVPASPPPVVRASTPSNNGNWNWEGGTAISVGQNETIEVIANRYGVPASAIAQANGITPNAGIYPGQRLVIPRYNYSSARNSSAASAPPSMAARPAPAPARMAAPAPQMAAPMQTAQQGAQVSGAHVHIVAPGENLTIIAKRYHKPLIALAAANKIPPYKMVRMGDRIVIPGTRAQTQAAPVAAAPAAPAPRVASAGYRPGQHMVSAEPTNTARVVTPTPEVAKEDTTASASAAHPMGSTPGFRWPVRGRIVTAFGPKPTGQQSDGINLAVPEGTPVKAADDGVVAYAGNELKGYGNLVLVRHPNGFVTAYAHASELMVKRGDSIKRGQVIAKSGQTGNVSSPQLHFEIRKGSSPVDPMQYLTGAT